METCALIITLVEEHVFMLMDDDLQERMMCQNPQPSLSRRFPNSESSFNLIQLSPMD